MRAKKQKEQSLTMNYLGMVLGFIFLMFGIFESNLELGGIGLVFIILSTTPMGETSLKKWYLVPLFPFPLLLDYIAPKNGFWILLIYGLVAIALIAALFLFAPYLIQSWLKK